MIWGKVAAMLLKVAKNTEDVIPPTCNFGLMLKIVLYSNFGELSVCIVGARISTETLQVIVEN